MILLFTEFSEFTENLNRKNSIATCAVLKLIASKSHQTVNRNELNIIKMKRVDDRKHEKQCVSKSSPRCLKD